MIKKLFWTIGFSLISPAAYANCASNTPYSAQWAGFTATTQSKFDAAALAEFSAVFGQIPAGTEIGFNTRLDLIRLSKGGYAAEAITSVLEHYSCILAEAHPNKAEEISDSIDRLIDDILPDILDATLYYDDDPIVRSSLRGERREVREYLRDAINEEQAQILPRSTTLSSIKKENFSRSTRVEAFVSIYAGDWAQVEGCAATGLQSIELVDSRIVKTLGQLRKALANYLDGGDGSGRARVITKTMNLLNELHSNPSKQYLNVPFNEVACVGDIAEIATTRVEQPISAAAQSLFPSLEQ